MCFCTATLLLLSACSDNPDTIGLPSCADSNTCASNPTLVIGGERPAMVAIPSNYDVNTRYPLVMVLHGRGVNGEIQALYMGLFDRVESAQFVLIYPDGRFSDDGRRQWRAAPTFSDTPPEEAAENSDVGYLRSLIEEAADTYSIDTGRIGLIGHSSGGFMSLTMACEASDYVTSIVQLAGSTFVDMENCQPAERPVSLLSIHGDQDDTVFFEGITGAYLSAPAVAERYAMLAGCTLDSPIPAGDVDLVASIEGAETSVTRWPGCQNGSEVEFWRINNGPHIPGPWVPSGLDAFVDWLLNHGRG